MPPAANREFRHCKRYFYFIRIYTAVSLKEAAKRVLRHPLVATVSRGFHNSWVRFEYDNYREEYDIHPSFVFNGEGIKMTGEGKIQIGEDSYMGRMTRLRTVEDTAVIIGEHCSISHQVMMYTCNREADQDLSKSDTSQIRGDIILGDDVWIGGHVFVTEDTKIGENTVVGANSVVTRDLPPHSIAAGTPALVRKFKSYLDKETVERLAKSHWDAISPDLQNRLSVDSDM